MNENKPQKLRAFVYALGISTLEFTVQALVAIILGIIFVWLDQVWILDKLFRILFIIRNDSPFLVHTLISFTAAYYVVVKLIDKIRNRLTAGHCALLVVVFFILSGIIVTVQTIMDKNFPFGGIGDIVVGLIIFNHYMKK